MFRGIENYSIPEVPKEKKSQNDSEQGLQDRIERERLGLVPEYIEEEGYTLEKMEDGLQEMRRRGEEVTAKEQEVRKIKQERLVSAREGFVNLRRSREVNDPGRISDKRELPQDGRLIDVHTGAGVIIDKEKDSFTGGVSGCLCAFIKSEEGDSMVHLTPKQSGDGFAYRQKREEAVMAMRKAMQEIGSVESAEVTIVGNGWEEARSDREAFVDDVRKLGVKKARMHEVPGRVGSFLDVFHSSESPDELIVYGDRYGHQDVRSISLLDEEDVFYAPRERLGEYIPDNLHEYLLDDWVLQDGSGDSGTMDLLYELLVSHSVYAEKWKGKLEKMSASLEDAKGRGCVNDEGFNQELVVLIRRRLRLRLEEDYKNMHKEKEEGFRLALVTDEEVAEDTFFTALVEEKKKPRSKSMNYF